MTKNKWSCLTAALSAPVNSEQTDNEQKENNRWINRSKNSTVELQSKDIFFPTEYHVLLYFTHSGKKNKNKLLYWGKKIREIENLFFFMSAP